MKDSYVRFDWAIKRLLRQKANFGVLEGFLTVFIGEPITILEILENHGEPRIVEGKSSSSKSKTFMRCIT